MWKEFIVSLTADNQYVKPNAPATIEQVQEVENKLEVILQKDIKDLLFELNGDSDLILSTQQIIDYNLMTRKMMMYDIDEDDYQPVDHYLFVAGDGCGDYYGYEITDDGIKDDNIYMWNHEGTDVNCNFIKVANNLKELIELRYTNRI